MNLLKKYLCILLAVLLLIPFIPRGYANDSPPSQWAHQSIEEAKGLNLVTPKILNNYQQNITREEFAELSVKFYEALSQNQAPEPSHNPFIDTDNPEVLKAYNLGIVGGVSHNKFAPQQHITREEIAVMILRVLRVGKSVKRYYTPRPLQCADESEVSSWAFDAILYLNYQGVIGGVGGNRINPKGKTTREQAIILVLRGYKLFDEEPTNLIIGTTYLPPSLDLHASNDLTSNRIMAQIYETLLTLDEQGNISPGLAKSWRQIDPLTYEFVLKKGVLFHNGETLTAHDVAFSLKRAYNSIYTNYIVSYLDPDRIKVIDNHTIRISTTIPYTPILSALTHIKTGILHEDTVLFAGDNYSFMFSIGTGPFQYHDGGYVANNLQFSSFKYYHGAKAKSDYLTFEPTSNYEDTPLSALESGLIDMTFDLAISNIPKAIANKDIALSQYTNTTTTYVGLNCEKGPLKDIRVRQAINYAIDTKAIHDGVYHGFGSPANGPISSAVWGAHPNLPIYGYDIDTAKKLLTEAGYPNGLKLTMLTNDSFERKAIAEMFRKQLELINIEVEVKVLEWPIFLDYTANGEYDMFTLGWITATGDADDGLYPLFHSSMAGLNGNRTFYSNARVDELLDLARQTLDPAKRIIYYLESQEIIAKEAPWVSIQHGATIIATRQNITGLKHHPLGFPQLSNIKGNHKYYFY